MMQMKKTCIIKNIALDDVDEKHVLKNMYYKNIALDDVDEKTCILKNIALDDVDEKTCIIKTLHLIVQMKNMY